MKRSHKRTQPTDAHPDPAKKDAPDRPLRSPLRYPGGKSRVALRLLRFIRPDHTEYREPFVGGGAIFLRKPKAETNWINDLHTGLCAFWRVLRDDFDDFADLCRQQDTTDLRATFDKWKNDTGLMASRRAEDLVRRAVQYFFINRTVWGGRVVYDPARRSRLYYSNPGGWAPLERKLKHLRACSEKLQGVTITRWSFDKCLADATDETFIYADPPYYRDSLDSPCSKLYEGHFSKRQHKRLRDLLAASPARVMISYDDREEVRTLYSDRAKWHIIELQWKYCGTYAKTRQQKAANTKEKKVTGRELLILNYPPPAAVGGEDPAIPVAGSI